MVVPTRYRAVAEVALRQATDSIIAIDSNINDNIISEFCINDNIVIDMIIIGDYGC